MKRYFFDFDCTLVDTSQVWPYMKTSAGRQFVVDHPELVPTNSFDDSIRKKVAQLHKKFKNVTVVTNAPDRYAKAMLQKHGFPDDLPVYGSMEKPLHQNLEMLIRGLYAKNDDVLVIGDTPNDVIAAHGCHVSSAAVMWSGNFEQRKINRSEPSVIIDSAQELELLVDEFESGNIGYSDRKDPVNYKFLEDKSLYAIDPEIKIEKVTDYHPTGTSMFKMSDSPMILTFKEAKSRNIEQIKQGMTEKYFYNGMVRSGGTYLHAINHFYRQITELIDRLGIKSNTYVFASPNSSPDFCYNLDINQYIAHKLNTEFFNWDDKTKRRFCRVYPKKEAHLMGQRMEHFHYRTIGDRNEFPKKFQPKNIIIFDDITKTGSQLTAIARMLRHSGYNGNIYGIVIGRTIGC